MPRTITLHPVSLALGLAIGAACLVSMAQTPQPPAVRIEYRPHPRDMVQIREGTPFVVPAGKIFVLTGLGAPDSSASFSGSRTSLTINGVEEAVVVGPLSSGGVGFAAADGFSSSLVAAVPLGLTAGPGAVIDVGAFSGYLAGRAWGYLADK